LLPTDESLKQPQTFEWPGGSSAQVASTHAARPRRSRLFVSGPTLALTIHSSREEGTFYSLFMTEDSTAVFKLCPGPALLSDSITFTPGNSSNNNKNGNNSGCCCCWGRAAATHTSRCAVRCTSNQSVSQSINQPNKKGGEGGRIYAYLTPQRHVSHFDSPQIRLDSPRICLDPLRFAYRFPSASLRSLRFAYIPLRFPDHVSSVPRRFPCDSLGTSLRFPLDSH